MRLLKRSFEAWAVFFLRFQIDVVDWTAVGNHCETTYLLCVPNGPPSGTDAVRTAYTLRRDKTRCARPRVADGATEEEHRRRAGEVGSAEEPL